jgi:hypothetical protein
MMRRDGGEVAATADIGHGPELAIRGVAAAGGR